MGTFTWTPRLFRGRARPSLACPWSAGSPAPLGVPSSPVVFLTPLSSGRQSAALPDWTWKIATHCTWADVSPHERKCALWASQPLFAPSARKRNRRVFFPLLSFDAFPLSQNCQCCVFCFSSLFLCSGPFGPENQKKSLLLQTQKTPGPKTLNPRTPKPAQSSVPAPIQKEKKKTKGNGAPKKNH